VKAALLVAGLALSSWASRAGCCCLASHAPFTARKPLPPAAQLGPAPAPLPRLRALLFGDFGDDTCQQSAVARGLVAAQARAPFDLAFSMGDNLYECGPDPRLPGAADCDYGPDGSTVRAGYQPPADPAFQRLFEGPLRELARDGVPVPVYLALGNHDVSSWTGCRHGELPPERMGRVKGCLEVAHQGPHWRMPGRHYLLDQGPARFVVIDSNLLAADYGGFTLDSELAFFREATRGCQTRPCFVVGHHPPATAGGHAVAAGSPFSERVRRLQEAASGPIAAWLAGHDHDLQHLRAAAGYDVFVSGNGARWRDEKFEKPGPAGAQLFFASTAWGHAVLEVSERHWAVRFESDQGEALHCCQAVFPGACQPVACGPAPTGPTAR